MSIKIWRRKKSTKIQIERIYVKIDEDGQRECLQCMYMNIFQRKTSHRSVLKDRTFKFPSRTDENGYFENWLNLKRQCIDLFGYLWGEEWKNHTINNIDMWETRWTPVAIYCRIISSKYHFHGFIFFSSNMFYWYWWR